MKKHLIPLILAIILCAGCLVFSTAQGSSLRRGTVTISRDEYERLQQYAKLDEVMQYIEAY